MLRTPTTLEEAIQEALEYQAAREARIAKHIHEAYDVSKTASRVINPASIASTSSVKTPPAPNNTPVTQASTSKAPSPASGHGSPSTNFRHKSTDDTRKDLNFKLLGVQSPQAPSGKKASSNT